jgi:hypothetical protein
MASVPPSTSASQLVSYSMCPRLYRFRYIEHRPPEFRSLNLVLGSVVHGAIGWWFEERLDGRKPSLDAVDWIVSADLLAETAEAPVRWKDETPDSLEAKAQGLVRAYLAEYGQQQVVAVEQRFEVDIADPDTGECLPRQLVGYFDLVVDDDGSIVEIKTTSRAWHPASLERHLQVGAYVAASNALHGGPSRVAVHAILKQKKPRIEVYDVERGEPGNRWFFEAAQAIEGAILAGHFPPAPGPCCIECEFGKTCLRTAQRATRSRSAFSTRVSQPACAL